MLTLEYGVMGLLMYHLVRLWWQMNRDRVVGDSGKAAWLWLTAFHTMEELYDTSFPTGPQADPVPAKTERNAEIRVHHKRG